MIIVYSKPNCVQCEYTKRTLDAKHITYTEIDVTEDAEAMARIAAWGYQQVPVVEVGPDHHWSGFRPDLIRWLLSP